MHLSACLNPPPPPTFSRSQSRTALKPRSRLISYATPVSQRQCRLCSTTGCRINLYWSAPPCLPGWSSRKTQWLLMQLPRCSLVASYLAATMLGATSLETSCSLHPESIKWHNEYCTSDHRPNGNCKFPQFSFCSFYFFQLTKVPVHIKKYLTNWHSYSAWIKNKIFNLYNASFT
jgi:hypothetical protein